MGTFTVTAKGLLTDAVKGSGRKATVQLAEEYARRKAPGQSSTDLSKLFALGEVPMKLYLTLVMLTRKPPHVLYRARPDHYWAEMLGYEELDARRPEPGAGTRRIKRAFVVLGKAGPRGTSIVTRTPEPGHGARIAVPIHPPSRRRRTEGRTSRSRYNCGLAAGSTCCQLERSSSTSVYGSCSQVDPRPRAPPSPAGTGRTSA
ncbi:hypothetical protein [Cellulomonas sp. ATA003]|uniref:hypothetical protein n=1 Tax=Cellulomonas sp. ATA003 TaxID=3073064 RepID=UPI0028737943|nr:hypothetical protein [Cellulomonas sp. ATA003]WNB85766.1 hypothetical protein REH70_20120 [Cellulomonas sp. ATA003]